MAIEVKTQAQLDKALRAHPDEIITLVGDGHFVFRGSSSPSIVTRGSSSPRIDTWDSSSPSIDTWDSSSPSIDTRGSSSPRIDTRDLSSPRIDTWGSSSPSGTVGGWSAAVVRQHGTKAPKIKGAMLLKIPRLDTPEAWLAYHGVKPTRGVAVLYKAVAPDYQSTYGMNYTPGSTPAAPDWDPVPECGGGLHFSPSPGHAREFRPARDTRFVACPVRVAEIVVHPDGSMPQKVKAPRVCKPCWEVNINGDPVGVA